MVRFCIVIPTSDSICTLAAAVESALAQDYVDFIVHVSDNASTDGSQVYLEQLRNVRLSVGCHCERLGKTENWNRAFRTAPNAEIFVMLHSDDILYGGTLVALAGAFDQIPPPALVFGNHDILSVDGSVITNKKAWPVGFSAGGTRFDRLQIFNNTVSIVGPAFPAAIFRAAGGFPVRYDFYQDMEFYHLVARLGRVSYIPVKFGLNRRTPPRPKSRLRFYIEEYSWLSSHFAVLPRLLREPVRADWVADAKADLLTNHPQVAAEFEAHLRSFDAGECWFRFLAPRMILHRTYKLWIMISSLVLRGGRP